MKKFLFVILMLAAAVLSAAEYELILKVNKESGVCKAGETAEFTCQVLKDKVPVEGMDVRYKVCSDNQRTKRGKFISGTAPWKYKIKRNTPGWAHIAFSLHGKDGKMLDINTISWERKSKKKDVGIGAIWEPEKLTPVYPEPADFDEFWAGVRKELDKVQIKAERVVSNLKGKDADRVVCYDVKVDCAGGMPVSGYLVMPKNAAPKSCPAMLCYDGAGVRSASKSLYPAARGVIVFYVNAHGIVNGKPKHFYDNLRKQKYNKYSHIGKQDRDTFYFKGMYMRVMRSLDYVKSLPEWDGKHLIVNGASQGGAQVFAACALDKDVTYAVAGVPAMSDHSGCLAKRSSGWPKLYKATAEGKPEDPAVAKAVAYYDNAYFAKRVKCPININTGLYDTTCVPTSVMAVYNMLPASTEKYLSIVPDGGHGATHASGIKRRDAYIAKAISENKNK